MLCDFSTDQTGPPSHVLRWCYDLASSLHKRNDVQGKGWLDFSSLDLTNGVARTDSEDNVSGARTCGSKGEPVMMAAEAGAEDTSSDGY